MLTATDLTGEETQEKKNPRFLLLVLALFIMAGIAYSAFWWIAKQETIAPIIEEKESIDASAQAWYDEQKKIMEANLNLQSDSAEAAVLIDSSVTNSATIDSGSVMPSVEPPESKLIKAKTETAVIINNVLNSSAIVEKVESSPNVEIKPKPAADNGVKSISRMPEKFETDYDKPVRSKKVIADNIKPTNPTQYFQQENRVPQYSGSVPPTNNKRPIEPVYIPIQKTQKETEKNAPSFNSTMITREELDEFIRQFPYKKTTIQFVCYVKPNEDMEAMKGQIIQFLRQNGYTDMETSWNIWSDHTPIKEVHYGKSGATSANFYIPSFR